MFRTVKFGEQGQLASFTGTSLTPREVEILRTIKCAVKPCFIARLTVRLNFHAVVMIYLLRKLSGRAAMRHWMAFANIRMHSSSPVSRLARRIRRHLR